jgi:hypothetical protein
MTYDELQIKTLIDKYKLDDEAAEAAHLIQLASEGYAEAVDKKDTSKLVLDQLHAGLSLEFRANSLEKITDSRITAMVDSDAGYIDQYMKHLAYKKDAERWKGLVEAFIKRAQMISDLVKLCNASYFGTAINRDETLIKEALQARKTVVDNYPSANIDINPDTIR